MNLSLYERHTYKDPNFPIIFHLDTCFNNEKNFVMHWHENLELLYIIEGRGQIACDMNIIEAGACDIVCINSNNLHYINSITPHCKYYCLIIDKNLCDSFDITVNDIVINSVVNDMYAQNLFDKIVNEMLEKNFYYKGMVKAGSIQLFMYLCRNFRTDKNTLLDTANSNKLKMVKESISYIKANFKDDITIENICKSIGLSKYYFCHIFKEVTGKTVIDYINFLRCDNARKLLITGDYNVSESSEICGFKNLSYFSKTYKKYIGKLPSSEYKNSTI